MPPNVGRSSPNGVAVSAADIPKKKIAASSRVKRSERTVPRKRRTVRRGVGDEREAQGPSNPPIIEGATSSSSLPETDHSQLAASMPMSGGMYGGGYGGGMGMMPMMSPMMMGGGMGGGGGGPLSGINNFLFGFQTVVFSLGQAMQIVGMNAQQLQQMYHMAMSMVDRGLTALNELQAISSEQEEGGKAETAEHKKRKRRLAALRWSMTVGFSFLLYKWIRGWIRRKRALTLGSSQSPLLTPSSAFGNPAPALMGPGGSNGGHYGGGTSGYYGPSSSSWGGQGYNNNNYGPHYGSSSSYSPYGGGGYY